MFWHLGHPDETSVAVLKNDDELLSMSLLVKLKSERFGGVVPSSQSSPCRVITACIEELVAEQVTEGRWQLFAVATDQAWVGALLVGLSAAQAFAWDPRTSLIPVNHMAGHLMAAQSVELEFPLLALLVSGGHTEVGLCFWGWRLQIVGETRDWCSWEACQQSRSYA